MTTDDEDDATPTDGRVADMAQLLLVCRRYYLTMFEDGLLEPQPDSVAAYFLAATEVGPEGPWPTEAASQPPTLAAKLARQQSDYLSAIGTLLLANEVFDPIGTLLRGSGRSTGTDST